ncbi:hypothetical protein CALCODRAFT_486435 [Calocera cornea HHB12733]|uniref:Mediator of RNA polymerase II transcription subunit 18 n=1 Tax=Calocera cornea HHB12733 TaxID=1353952 RepID=A0A165DQ75_9BASI|nr:hypothetical protein CALCODRAFT_486435 [Calocera cornea HHB12733]
MSTGPNHPFEVSLSGSFTGSPQAVLDRLSLHCAQCKPLHMREVVLEPRYWDGPGEGVLLRCRREEGRWSLCALMKPEPERLYTDVTVRAAIYSFVHSGDALAFASGLGYKRKTELWRKGHTFYRGELVIHVFRSEAVDSHSNLPIPPHREAPYEVEVKSAPSKHGETPIAGVIEEVVEIRTLLKGLVDLERADL